MGHCLVPSDQVLGDLQIFLAVPGPQVSISSRLCLEAQFSPWQREVTFHDTKSVYALQQPDKSIWNLKFGCPFKSQILARFPDSQIVEQLMDYGLFNNVSYVRATP